jgi:hypothetical protein
MAARTSAGRAGLPARGVKPVESGIRPLGTEPAARTGERGGARLGKPRWVRILAITAGSSMAAMIFKALPQFGQRSISMSKTRLSRRAQLMRAGEQCGV